MEFELAPELPKCLEDLDQNDDVDGKSKSKRNKCFPKCSICEPVNSCVCSLVNLPKKTLKEVCDKSDKGTIWENDTDKEGKVKFSKSKLKKADFKQKIAIPDVVTKTCGVNNSKDKCAALNELSGCGHKDRKFHVNGGIKIRETQCGGLFETKKACKKTKGKRKDKQLVRVADSEAGLEKVCPISDEIRDERCCCQGGAI